MTAHGANWSLYAYQPTKAAPIVFAVIICLLASLHAYQSYVRYKWPRFGGMMMFGSAVWLAAFICRAVSAWNVQSVEMYIAQYVLILMGPPFYAAAETFIMGRLFAYLPYHAPLHPGRVVSTFIFLSAVVEALSASGASNSAGNSKDLAMRETGHNLLKAGLLLQAMIEVLFSSLLVHFQLKVRRAKHMTHNVKVMCIVLYVTSAMMFVRCIIRAVEGFEASDCSNDPSLDALDQLHCGYIVSHEWFLWVFEVANITIFIAALAVFTPGKYLPRSDKQYLDPSDAQTERMGPGFAQADRRGFLLTVVDPFNLWGIVTGRGMPVDEKFWHQQHPVADTNYARFGKETINHDQLKVEDSA